jgi:Arc/MetJ family transcription regulator
MRTNIDIDDNLMRQAMKATGAVTKKATVENALRKLVEVRAEEASRKQAIAQRRGQNGQIAEEDWLEKWLAGGWK